jgi:hypothetical protein
MGVVYQSVEKGVGGEAPRAPEGRSARRESAGCRSAQPNGGLRPCSLLLPPIKPSHHVCIVLHHIPVL